MNENTVLKKTNTALLLPVSLLSIVLGVYVLLNPAAALLAIALYIGIGLVLMGIGYALIYQKTNSSISLIWAVLDIIVGSLFLFDLGVSVVTIPIIFALWILGVAVTQAFTAFWLKKNKNSSWIWLFISALIGIIFAGLIIMHPIIGILTLTVLMGGFLIIYGVSEFIRYLKV
ncbi:MAG: HdeD family acid-resistance protein [Alphaproteobacteria bacterium]